MPKSRKNFDGKSRGLRFRDIHNGANIAPNLGEENE